MKGEIVTQGADYIIALKKNQGGLYNRVVDLFKQNLQQQGESIFNSGSSVSESNHGREEIRYYQVLNNVQEEIDPQGEWQNLNSVIKFDYLRIDKKGKMTHLFKIIILRGICKPHLLAC